MKWTGLTIGKKNALGFGIVLTLLGVVVILSFTGVVGIVQNAEQVIDGNSLDGLLAQMEVDHLNWAGKVNSLLTDDHITELDVETDHHKCNFGKWLYGEGRKEAERLVPRLAQSLKDLEEPHQKLHESAMEIGENFKQADPALPGFLATREMDILKWVVQVNETFSKNLPGLNVMTDDWKCPLGQWLYAEGAKKATSGDEALANLIDPLKEAHKRLHQSAVDIRENYRQIHPGLLITLSDRLSDNRMWVIDLFEGLVGDDTKFMVELDPAKCRFGRFLNSEKTAALTKNFPALKAAIENSKEPHVHLHESAVVMENAIKEGNRPRAHQIFRSRTLPALEELSDLFQEGINAERLLVKAQEEANRIYETKTLLALKDTSIALNNLKERAEQMLVGAQKANSLYANKTMPTLLHIQDLLKKVRMEAKENVVTDEIILKTAQKTKRNVIVMGTFAVIVGILLALLISRKIVTILQRVSTRMKEGADQVASSCAEVSDSSQNLAEGASHQAASIEEISSSMEEMSSMTKQNADHANQADSLMKEANQVVSHANEVMSELTTTMEETSRASEETQKIIKTIDEIAFQTNLLALNAAVEAARAGEAGAGFAVVADEVRNLAIRSAEAARNTATLIESTVKKINDGSGLVKKTDDAFRRVAESSNKVVELVSEIATASTEQAGGIKQVNISVAEMDKIVQKTAANAEGSASASEEMTSQARQMKMLVGELMLLLGKRMGQGGDFPDDMTSAETTWNQGPGIEHNETDVEMDLPPQERGSENRDREVQRPKHWAHRRSEEKPQQAISIDDECFEDF